MEVDLPSSHFVTNVVMLDINVLCLSMLDGVVAKGNGSLIVAFKRDEGVY